MDNHVHTHVHIHHEHELCEINRKLALVISNQEKIMAKFEEGITALNAKLDTLATGIDGVAGDVTNLTAEVAALKTQLGELTPEQAAAMQAVVDRTSGLVEKVTTLDAQTDNAPPTT